VLSIRLTIFHRPGSMPSADAAELETAGTRQPQRVRRRRLRRRHRAGLWKIVQPDSRSNGAVSPSLESAKCFTAEQARDLVATFSPQPRMINSGMRAAGSEPRRRPAEVEAHLQGPARYGVIGDYKFRDQHQYAGIVRTTTAMAGQPMSDTVTTLYAERVSDCP